MTRERVADTRASRRGIGLAIVVLIAAACGSDSPAPTAESSATTTTAVASSAGRRYVTQRFEVPFTIDQPETWKVVERDTDLIQLWIGEREEDSPLEISLGFDVTGTPSQVMAAYEGTQDVTAGSVESGQYGDHPVLYRELEGGAAPQPLPGGYRIGPGDRLRVVAIDTGERTIVALLDTVSERDPTHVDERMDQMVAVLSSLEVEG